MAAPAHLEALRQAEASLREPASASDDASIVTIDIEDIAVSRVVVARDWFDRGEVAGLTAACQQAYDNVTNAMKLRYFERIEQARVRDEAGQSVCRAAPRTNGTGSVGAFRREVTAPDPAAVNRIVAQLSSDLDRLDRVRRENPPGQPLPAPEPRTVTGTSENGQLRAVFEVTDDDSLTALEMDPRWAQRQSALQLGDMIKQAMNDAIRAMRELAPQPNEYQKLAAQFGRTADAAASLARRSGLR